MTNDGSDRERDDSAEQTASGAILKSSVSEAGFVYDALSAERRRILCRVLAEEGTQPIDDLAMAVAGVDRDEPTRDVTNYEWEAVYASLYHQHVPKLVSLDIVAFDRDTGSVEPAERFQVAVAALEEVERLVENSSPCGGFDD